MRSQQHHDTVIEFSVFLERYGWEVESYDLDADGGYAIISNGNSWINVIFQGGSFTDSWASRFFICEWVAGEEPLGFPLWDVI